MTSRIRLLMTNLKRGWFLAFEGPDGSGKTTQATLVANLLREGGHEVITCRDPGGTSVGDRIRSLLLDRSSLVPSLRTEMLLYMASRAQLVDEVIRPAMERGCIVISDRYLLSNLVYQGYAGGLDLEEIAAVGRTATAGLMPDLTILIDITPELGRSRIGTPRDRMEDRPDDYHRRVRDGFLQAIESYPSPTIVFDGSGPTHLVEQQIFREVCHALGLDSRS